MFLVGSRKINCKNLFKKGSKHNYNSNNETDTIATIDLKSIKDKQAIDENHKSPTWSASGSVMDTRLLQERKTNVMAS